MLADHATEEVLTQLQNVMIAAAVGETPIFDGTLPVVGTWEPVGNGVYQAALAALPLPQEATEVTDSPSWLCESFCSTHTSDWASKCKWGSLKCHACPECAMPPSAPPPTPPAPPTGPGEIRLAPWQLFAGESRSVVGVARWPDAQPWTDDSYNRNNKWRHFGPGTVHDTAGAGVIFDSVTEGDTVETLAATNVSFEGCIAVLNNGHCAKPGLTHHAHCCLLTRLPVVAGKSMASQVTSHVTGSDSFTFDNPRCGRSCPGTSYNDDGKGRYFMEACPAALTSDNEWSYDLQKQRLLLRLPGGADPGSTSLYGKVSTWAMVLNDCTNVTLRGLTFFATTVGIYNTDTSTGGNTIVDCAFDYSTASLRPRGYATRHFCFASSLLPATDLPRANRYKDT